MKTCNKCKIPQPLDPDHFPLSTKNRTGYEARCRACYRAKALKYRKENRDNIRKRAAGRYIENRNKICAERAEYAKKYPERIRARSAKYYAENKEKILARNAKHAKDNPEKEATRRHLRRARKAAAPIVNLANAQWQEILAAYHYRCVYCPPACKLCKNRTHTLTQDHIQPLSKGGSHTASNIVPACNSCNAKKNTGPVPVPVQPMLLTLAPPKKG